MPNTTGKLTHKEAQYESNPGSGGCGVGKRCRWYNGGNCPIVGSHVPREACCDHYNDPNPPKGIGKRRAGFVSAPGHTEFLCDDCKFLVVDGREVHCTVVVDPIRPEDVCLVKWQPGKRRGLL